MGKAIVGVALMTLCGCTREAPAAHLESSLRELATPVCATVDKAALGQLPLEVDVGGKTVRFAEWTTADELSQDLVGFAAQLPAEVVFTVRAGERTFTGTTGRWVHPAGVSGPRVHGIDALTFCTLAARPTLALAR